MTIPAAVLVLALAGGSSAPVEAELRTRTQAMLDAIAPGDAAVWRRALHERFVHLDENGIVRNREELLRELTPLPAGLVGRIAIDRFQVAVHGSAAVATYEMQEHLDYHGQTLRTRFRSMDTWLKTPDGWRLASQHTAAVLEDPPTVRLPRADLCAYEGVYALTPAITTTVARDGDGLRSVRADRPAARYVAEIRDVFFVAGQPRTRRIFTRGDDGRVTGFVDRREGEDVRWTRTGPAVPAAGASPDPDACAR